MGKLDSLRITESPAAFAEMARKHNALVAIIEAMTGTGGAKVAVAENNIVIAASGGTPTAITQTEFNAMLEVAIEGATGSLDDALNDRVINAVVAFFPAETVEVCGIGSLNVLTTS